MKYFKKIQRKNRTYHGRWDCDPRQYELNSEKSSVADTSILVDKMTQYGEDNPDEDFFEGAKFMAIKILQREAETQNTDIDYEAYKPSSTFDSSRPWDNCPYPGDCSKWPDNCDDKCGKYYCEHCCGWDDETKLPIYECKCNCKKRICDCELEDSDFDPEDIDNSDDLDEFDDSDDSITDDDEASDEFEGSFVPNECDCENKEYCTDCHCEKCNCAQTKLQREQDSDPHYAICKRYQEWQSQTPGELVEELSEKIVELRGGPYVSPSKRPVSVSPKVDKYGPDGVGPWG